MKKVIIKKIPTDEFRVNVEHGKEKTASYHTDLDDAVSTARLEYPGATIVFRRKDVAANIEPAHFRMSAKQLKADGSAGAKAELVRRGRR